MFKISFRNFVISKPFLIHETKHFIITKITIIKKPKEGLDTKLQASNHIFYTDIWIPYQCSISPDEFHSRFKERKTNNFENRKTNLVKWPLAMFLVSGSTISWKISFYAEMVYAPTVTSAKAETVQNAYKGYQIKQLY